MYKSIKNKKGKNMEITTDTELVNINDTLGLATWNTPRSLSELRNFVSMHEEALDVEDFDF